MSFYINLVLYALLLTGCATIKKEQLYPVRNIVFYYSGRDPLITHSIPVQPLHNIPASSRNSINDSYWRIARRTYEFYPDYQSFPANILGKENLTRVVSTGTWHGYMYEEICSETSTLYVYTDHKRWGPVLYLDKFGQRTQFINAIKGLIEANCTPNDISMIQIAVFLPFVLYREHDKNRYLDSEELEGTPEGLVLDDTSIMVHCFQKITSHTFGMMI